jgi:hypothetical protein
MSRKTLLVFSIFADVLDFLVVGQIPILSWVIDIPLIVLHVQYAGLRGLWTLLELVPFVGLLPVFTIATFAHKPISGGDDLRAV